jgi:hypothetical protein
VATPATRAVEGAVEPSATTPIHYLDRGSSQEAHHRSATAMEPTRGTIATPQGVEILVDHVG